MTQRTEGQSSYRAGSEAKQQSRAKCIGIQLVSAAHRRIVWQNRTAQNSTAQHSSAQSTESSPVQHKLLPGPRLICGAGTEASLAGTRRSDSPACAGRIGCCACVRRQAVGLRTNGPREAAAAPPARTGIGAVLMRAYTARFGHPSDACIASFPLVHHGPSAATPPAPTPWLTGSSKGQEGTARNRKEQQRGQGGFGCPRRSSTRLLKAPEQAAASNPLCALLLVDGWVDNIICGACTRGAEWR
jgi:hypothetical protein